MPVGDDLGEPLGLVAALEDRGAEVDVVDVERVAVDVDVGALQAALLAGLPRQIVLGVVDDREPAEDRVAELVAAQLAGRRHHPAHPQRRRRFPRCGCAARPRADDFLQRDDIGADVTQHGGDPIGACAPVHPDDR